MAEKKRQIFRKQSLDKLSSPERLDQLLRIVKPQSWVPLLALSLGACLVVVWAIVGIVPETVRGPAILVRPEQVTEFHALADGQIKTIEVSPGDDVQEGDLLATLELPTLVKAIQVENAKLTLVRRHGGLRKELEETLAETQLDLINQRRARIAQRINDVRSAAEAYKTRQLQFVEERRRNLTGFRDSFLQIEESLKGYATALAELVVDGVLPDNALIRAQSDLVNVQVELADLNVTEGALTLRESQIMEYYDQRMDIIQDLELKTDELDVRELEIARRLKENELQNELAIAEIELEIGRLTAQLESEGELLSAHTGIVLEINVAIGHQVAVGQALGKIAIANPSTELMAIAYLTIKDGKKVKAGQEIRVSPVTFERERFGGIRGRVESVSEFPISFDAATHEIGDQRIASDLLGGEARIRVVVRLEKDPTSSTEYLWTFGTGPPGEGPPTPGTTADVRVTLANRAPITLVFPFLKSLLSQ
jgi:HlyD family secretion protein